LIGKGDPSHPQAPAITVLSIVIRTVLSYRYYERTRQLSSELLGVLKQSTYHEPAWELLLEICRVGLVGGTKADMDFINDTLSEMTAVPGSPRLPRSTVNDYIGSVRPRQGAGFFFNLKQESRPTLTAVNILRLATLREKTVLNRLEKEISELSESEWGPEYRQAFEACKRPPRIRFGIRPKADSQVDES
jgi:hypothetical protein